MIPRPIEAQDGKRIHLPIRCLDSPGRRIDHLQWRDLAPAQQIQGGAWLSACINSLMDVSLYAILPKGIPFGTL